MRVRDEGRRGGGSSDMMYRLTVMGRKWRREGGEWRGAEVTEGSTGEGGENILNSVGGIYMHCLLPSPST